MKKAAFIFLCMVPLWADGKGVIESVHAKRDVPLTANPKARHWKSAVPAIAENGPTGDPVPGHRTEIRSFWTDKNLYLLFTCPYEELNLKADPDLTKRGKPGSGCGRPRDPFGDRAQLRNRQSLRAKPPQAASGRIGVERLGEAIAPIGRRLRQPEKRRRIKVQQFASCVGLGSVPAGIALRLQLCNRR